MKTSISFSLLLLLLGAATVLNIGLGSVWIPPQEVFQSLFYGPLIDQSHEYILWSYRAPKTATAMAVGGGLALCGLLMQSLFRNPLSGPYVLGLSSGASLGVSLLILGSSIGLPGWALIENTGIGRIAAAALGAVGVLALVVATASRVKDTMALLLVGLMIGSITSAVVSIFTYLSDEQSLKQYAIWTMGQLGGIQGPWLYGLWILVVLGVLLSIPLAKSMNAVLLGESTALSLGIDLKTYQWMVIAITGALTGGITALVGPIAFVGLAVPHLCRIGLQTSDHRLLIPAVLIGGAIMMLLCDTVAQWPGSASRLPINAVTSLVGAPILIWLIWRIKKAFV